MNLWKLNAILIVVCVVINGALETQGISNFKLNSRNGKKKYAIR
jgi:hypothetical protein